MWAWLWASIMDLARDMAGDWCVKLLSTAGLMVACGVFGGWDVMASGLCILWAFDFALGLFRAFLQDCFAWARFRRGFAKIFLYASATFAAVTLDEMLTYWAGGLFHSNFRAVIILYLAVCDGLSIMEHLSALGCPLPAVVVKRLRDYRDCSVFTGRPEKGRNDG